MTAPNYPHVARRRIEHDGVTAFNPGDLIPDGTPSSLGLVDGEDYEANPGYVTTSAATVQATAADGDVDAEPAKTKRA